MTSAFVTRIFRTNIVLFALLIPILFGFPFDDESRIFRLSGSLVLLAVIFVLPAINATAILSRITRKTLDTTEFFSVAAVISILFVPFLVSIEADALHILSPHLPIINAVSSFLLFAFLFRFPRKDPGSEIGLFEEKNARLVQASFVASIVIVASSIFAIVAAYYPLPDLDPYYWVALFQDQFAKGIISSLSSSRPLFSSLAYLFNQSAGVDLYSFFKYLLPFFALFPLLPAMLIARRFTRAIEQISIFLLPLANASFFLYSTLPIPQAIFNSLLATAILFSLHSLLSGKKIFFHIAGVILFVGFFYHEMAAIPFVAWLLSFLFFERKRIVHFAETNKLAAGLVIVLILSYLPLIAPIFSFVADWSGKLSGLIATSRPNFAFPAEYVNIDGNSAGWQGAAGVIRYYAFYFGPAALIALVLSSLVLRNPGIRALLRREETLFLLMSAGAFLLMSDIFPRLFSIALLPERALGFVSLFLLSLIPIIFLALHERKERISRFIPALLLLAFLINLGAALYINDLKKYLITPSQLVSAEWIKGQLPEDRVIFSVGNSRLIRLHANSTVAEVDDPAFYSDKDTLEQYVQSYAPETPDHTRMIRERLLTISDTLADLSNKQTTDESDFLPSLQKESGNLVEITHLIEETKKNAEKNSDSKYYIYYAAPSEKNPYINRPYMPKPVEGELSFIFDRYPERFRMIYSDTKNEIYIWEIL